MAYVDTRLGPKPAPAVSVARMERGNAARLPPVNFPGAHLRSTLAPGLKASALSLASMFFIAVAGAQPPDGSMVSGRQPQPIRQQLESTNDRNAVEWDRWNRRVAPELDRLNDEIMRATEHR